MRPTPEFRAITTIYVASVRAYNVGDDVPASAVDNLGLTVGEHVEPANAHIIPHPGRNAKVGELRAYALGQGVDQEAADDMTKAQLLDRFPEPTGPEVEPPASVDVPAPDGGLGEPRPDLIAAQATEQTVDQPQHPGSRATKPELVEYAVALGMDRGDAEAMTVKDLHAKLPE